MRDRSILSILEKAKAGERLSESDAVSLFNSPDLMSIGKYADTVNKQVNKDLVFYNVNRHINPTNICAHTCKFCAFSRKPGDEGGYAYTTEEIIQKASEAVKQGATEVHMVGGLHPRWAFEVYLEFIRAIKENFPSLHIKAFTAVELSWMAKKARTSIENVLIKLREAGLDSLPGGGAEIFHPEIREVICDTKLTGDEWIGIHKLAHNMGIRSNATMLYGHIENFSHRVDHMMRLRNLQDETGGFNVFIPLAFQPYNNQMGIGRYTYSFDDLKTIAVARLFLDNFKNIKAYWVMMGQDIAQLALSFGANDLDGTVNEEKISKMAGGKAGMTMSRRELESLITQTGKYPQERDTLYNPLGKPSRDNGSEVKEKESGSDSSNFIDANPFMHYADDDDYGTWLNIFKNSSINDLGILAHKVKSSATRNINAQGFSVTKDIDINRESSLENIKIALTKINPEIMQIKGASLSFKLGADASLSLTEFLMLLEIVTEDLALPMRICGINELKTMILEEGLAFSEGLREVARRGKIILEMDKADTSHIDIEDLIVLAKAIHYADLKWLAMVKIPVGYVENDGQILHHIQYLKTLGQISEDYQNILGVAVTHVDGVSAIDYLKGIALTRILIPQTLSTITPLNEIPASCRVELAIEEGKKQPQKLASLVSLVGSDDFGGIDIDALDYVSLCEEIFISAREPELRDAWLSPCAAKYEQSFSRQIKEEHFTSFDHTLA